MSPCVPLGWLQGAERRAGEVSLRVGRRTPRRVGSPGSPGPPRGDALLRGTWSSCSVSTWGSGPWLSPGLLPGDASSHRRLREADTAAHAVGSRLSPARTRHCDLLTVVTQSVPFDPHHRLRRGTAGGELNPRGRATVKAGSSPNPSEAQGAGSRLVPSPPPASTPPASSVPGLAALVLTSHLAPSTLNVHLPPLSISLSAT